MHPSDMFIQRLIWWLPVIALLPWNACATSTTPMGAPVSTAADADSSPAADEAEPIELLPGDTLQVKFFYYPELNTTARVREDGRISLELVDDVYVEGLTPEAVDTLLTEQYAGHLRYPTLTVIVADRERRVFVGGEVNAPGMLQLEPRMTLSQAVYTAGSYTDEADVSQIVLLRDRGSGPRTMYVVNLKDVLKASVQDPPLEAFDVVVVPKSGIANLNLFVDQYINRTLPFSRGFSYSINRLE